MGQATEPIEFGGQPSGITEHFTFVPESTTISAVALRELSAVCDTSTDALDTAQHGRDWWPLAMHWSLAGQTPRRPEAVCRPSTTPDVVSIVGICKKYDLALTVSGGRSGVCGAAVPLFGGVVLDTTLMKGICSVDSESGIVEVLPGTFGPEFEDELRTKYHLSVGHFPQSFDISTVGGWVACRGAGQFSTRYGKIEDMVVALEVVLANGSVVVTGGAPASASGPELTALFVGSEGTLGVITRIWLRAHPLPKTEQRAAYLFSSLSLGIETCRDIIRCGASPAVLRLYDPKESERSHGTDGTRCTLLVLDEGEPALVEATMHIVDETARKHGAEIGDVTLVEKWMHHRNDTSGLQALARKGYIVDTMEVSAPWSKLNQICTDVRAALLAVTGARGATCHLSHSYLDGACLYFTFAAQVDKDALEATYVQLWNAAQRAALFAGSNISHHHGIGINRGRFMPEALGGAFDVLVALKSTLDPHDMMNPGKLGLPTKRGKVVWP